MDRTIKPVTAIVPHTQMAARIHCFLLLDSFDVCRFPEFLNGPPLYETLLKGKMFAFAETWGKSWSCCAGGFSEKVIQATEKKLCHMPIIAEACCKTSRAECPVCHEIAFREILPGMRMIATTQMSEAQHMYVRSFRVPSCCTRGASLIRLVSMAPFRPFELQMDAPIVFG